MHNLKFSSRLNSFFTEPNYFWDESKESISTLDLIERMSKVEGLTHVELNYPQHFEGVTIDQIKEKLQELDLQVSGIALRYDQTFYKGEFTNSDDSIRQKAITLTEEAIDICNELGGSVTTIWMANDGFDYSFQLNYQEAWNMQVEAIREVAQKNPTSQISIEYKPYQPRAFTLFSDIGTTLLGIEDINCDNVGITLDLCHMLMKKENPALSLALAQSRGKLMGVHLNDGYQDNDDGMMLSSVHFMQTLEFIYYLKKYNYDGLIYFDTFPVREDPIKECETNIKVFKQMSELIDKIGVEHIAQMIQNKDSIESQNMLLTILNTFTADQVQISQ
ncbi:sugar phosphate isomerase/epimerase family protein [Gracilibacillus sp. YIM 98692]|uniref:sugar phosphate isomerase/epimerase family protein n=1 Tax=Gracilibacillus sp. YIM 98692 TaxID=2663532 RepID=UPI0013D0F576|nr:sugar phosphate isomerase/epimerase family protein [Gracilibacillus sp. YIM 98692]